jgi:hypothetical protein
MKTISDVRDQLAEIFEDLRNKDIKPNEADSLANIAGKMIASAKVQLDYYALTKTKADIPFLDNQSKVINQTKQVGKL